MWTKLCWSFSKCWLLGLLSTSGVNLMEIPSEEIRLLRKIDRFLTALPCCKIKTCSLSNPDTFLTLTREKIKPWCPQVWTNSFKQGESCNIYKRKFPFQPAFFFFLRSCGNSGNCVSLRGSQDKYAVCRAPPTCRVVY